MNKDINFGGIVNGIISGVISIIIIDMGSVLIINKVDGSSIVGLLIIILGFLLLYFSFYALQIKENQDDIIDLKEEINKIKQDESYKEKLLNRLRDIIMLNNIKKEKMNKEGRVTSSDILEIIKIIIALIVGYIIIKALLSAA
mgnify:FL=1